MCAVPSEVTKGVELDPPFQRQDKIPKPRFVCLPQYQSESYFNEAERLDPRNAYLLGQHASSYVSLRRFPEASRKFDQVLNITPDDPDTLAVKANIYQAEGDLPRAAALLASLHPNADETSALETQVYQAILERQPAPMITRAKGSIGQA
jgi:tetratricopeptide (TPR) repeat protein